VLVGYNSRDNIFGVLQPSRIKTCRYQSAETLLKVVTQLGVRNACIVMKP